MDYRVSTVAEWGFRFSVILSLLWVSCASSDGISDKAVTPPEFEIIDVTLMPGGVRPSITLSVKLAKTEAQRRYGLMFTSHLPDQHGMLFVFKTDAVRKFWMKNTSIPLDIAFANETGEVLRIAYNTRPFSLDLIDGGEDIQYVLEINAGLSEALNIFVGSKFSLSNFRRQPYVLC